MTRNFQTIGTLAGGIAHDFNNILAAIIGFAKMVEEDLPKDSLEGKHLNHVMQSAHGGKELVKKSLRFPKMSNMSGATSLPP